MSNAPKVLIVDDDPNILMSLEFLMRKDGYKVFIARNGNEAMELLEQNRPDLTLLDIMMPDVDGYAICAHVKSSDHLKDCKIVFISAKTHEADIRKGYDYGADLYITKPFSTKNVVMIVKDLLSAR
jgi:DNA-binding response OmpR family regulator